MNPEHIDHEIYIENRKLILEVYDELYYYMLKKPEGIWETEALAATLKREERYQQLNEMLEAYQEAEDYTKCAKINEWINALEATYAMMSVKASCIK